MYHDVLEASPLFRLLGHELMLELCQAVIPVSAIKAQTIFNKGDVGHEMYFVVRGEVEVLDSDNVKLGYIGHGGFFGEKTVIEAVHRKFGTGSCLRSRTVSATADTDLAMLETRAILSVCNHYPELEVRLRSFKRAGTSLGLKGKAAIDARRLRAATVAGVRDASANDQPIKEAQPVPGEVDGDQGDYTADKQSEWMDAGRQLLKASNGDLKLAIARLMGAFQSLSPRSYASLVADKLALTHSHALMMLDAHTQETQAPDLDDLMASVRAEISFPS